MEAPKRIYLQACGDCTGGDCENCKFDDLEYGVTWHPSRIYKKAVEYIRNDDKKKAPKMTKKEAMERAYDVLERIIKGGESEAIAGLALVSAHRAKDYKWFAKQLDDFIDMFEGYRKVLDK